MSNSSNEPVEKKLDRARGVSFAALLLRPRARLSAPQDGLLAALFQPVEDVLHCRAL